MKILITESQSENIMSKLLEKLKIKTDLLYWGDDGRNSLSGTVYLYKDGKILGNRSGYEFFFKYDKGLKSLIYNGHFPKIENVNVFRSLPSEFVVNYFSDKMKDYLENFIKKGHSGIKWG